MASITIRNLDESVKQGLKVRAANSGRSMEAEARNILEQAVVDTGWTGKPAGYGRSPAPEAYDRGLRSKDAKPGPVVEKADVKAKPTVHGYEEPPTAFVGEHHIDYGERLRRWAGIDWERIIASEEALKAYRARGKRK